MPEELLRVENLRTQIATGRATVRAVDGVSLTVQRGQTVGVVGESGSGKSMTGMSIMRLLPPGGRIVEGSIKLGGVELMELSEKQMRGVRGREVAMVFQDPMTALNPTMTIGDQVAETVRIHRNVSRDQARKRALEVLDLVGIPRPNERMRAYPHHLSGGLRQRVVIAAALACEPQLLIADEPTTALDVTIQNQILDLLENLKTQLDMGMLLITHDMGVIADCADVIVVMYAGEIVEAAEVNTVFNAMRHPYTQALLEAIPDLDTDRNQLLYTIPGQPPDLANPPDHCRFAARCRYASEQCRTRAPELTDVGGHQYACFHPVDGPAERRTVTATDPTNGASSADDRDDEPLLVLDHVTKEFPIRTGVLQRRTGSLKAVTDVSLSVFRGETLGLVGESGCGKSTIARLILALDHPDSGEVRFDGQDISQLGRAALRRRRAEMQIVFQDPYASLDPRMRVGSVVREPLSAQRIGGRDEQNKQIRDLLGDVGLSAQIVDSYPHQFSGGQRQRIAIARALTVSPRLIVADEPTSALDVSIQSQVLNLMRRLQREHDLTYVLISHDLTAVRYLADRVGVMYLGSLVELAPSAELYTRPAHPYSAGLLAAVPTVQSARTRTRSSMVVRGELPSAVNPPSGCRFRTRCPRAQDICATEPPALRTIGSAAHYAACHFPLDPEEGKGPDARAGH